MHNFEGCPFTTGIYRNIKLNYRNECSICLMEFEEDTLITNTRCKHSFCNECFSKLLKMIGDEHIKCPMCRTYLCNEH